jgi:DnaD/phage-associated family protein
MRHISPKILEDPWYTSLTLLERQAWIGLLLTVDDQGRFIANPTLIRSKVFPTDDFVVSDIENVIQVLLSGKKVHLYEVDGVRYGQIINWWKYQRNTEFMAPSKYPAPKGWADCWRVNSKGHKFNLSSNWDTRGGGWISEIVENDSQHSATLDNPHDNPCDNPRDIPGELQRSLYVNDNDKVNENDNVSTTSDGEVFRAYSDNFGAITAMTADELIDLEKTYTREWVLLAMQEAVKSEARNLKYVGAILKRWKVEGLGSKKEKGKGTPIVVQDQAKATVERLAKSGW